MHDYLGCVEAVDESVGRVLDYLDERAWPKNTIVVYSSDQGFYLGEHGWFDKRWIFEESLRTPLLVRWPGVTKAGERERQDGHRTSTSPRRSSTPPACQVPADMQGRSLVPLLKGQTRPTGGRASTTTTTNTRSRTTSQPASTASCTDRYKLVHFYDLDDWELFDLEKDPHELKSVYKDPAYASVVTDLKIELKRLMEKYKDDGTTVVKYENPNPPMPKAKAKAKAKAKVG